MRSLDFTPSVPSTYFTAGAARDPKVVQALLGRIPHYSVESVTGLNLGIVKGSALIEEARFDLDIKPNYGFRFLVPDRDSIIDVVCYNGITPDEIELFRKHALEGVATRGVEHPIGLPDPVGIGLIHILNPGIQFDILPLDRREIHPNGQEASIEGALTTRNRFLEHHRGPSPERK